MTNDNDDANASRPASADGWQRSNGVTRHETSRRRAT